MDKDLQDIIQGTLLGDACITVSSGKYFNYKHVAKDRKYLEWQSKFLENCGIKYHIGVENKISKTHRLSFYINSKRNEFLDSLHEKWYKAERGKNIKQLPSDIIITPTVLSHWYLGDGSLIRQSGNRIPRIVLATNNFSADEIQILINKLDDIELNFYPLLSLSGFGKGSECGRVLVSRTNEGTPFRFFKMIGFDCPVQIKRCSTGRKGKGAKKHYFKDKWPTEEDWLRILSNVEETGKIVRKRREDLSVDRKTIALHTGVTKKHIERIETGRRYPSVEVFRKLLNILDINAYYLLKEIVK